MKIKNSIIKNKLITNSLSIDSDCLKIISNWSKFSGDRCSQSIKYFMIPLEHIIDIMDWVDVIEF